jgi:hypothetical protein
MPRLRAAPANLSKLKINEGLLHERRCRQRERHQRSETNPDERPRLPKRLKRQETGAPDGMTDGNDRQDEVDERSKRSDGS